MEIATRGGVTAALLLGEEITRAEMVGSGLVLASLVLNVWAASRGDLRRQVWARP